MSRMGVTKQKASIAQCAITATASSMAHLLSGLVTEAGPFVLPGNDVFHVIGAGHPAGLGALAPPVFVWAS